MTRARISLLSAVLVLAGALAIAAVSASPTDRADRLASELRCPVCQGLSVKDSPSQAAREVRALIAERIAEGRSDDEIRDEFRGSYGDWVMLAPRADPLGALVWIAPAAAVVLGGLVAWSRVRPRAAAS